MSHISEPRLRGVAVSNERSIGRHLMADMYGVQGTLLSDAPALLERLVVALEAANFHVIEQHSHRFPGAQAGVTAFVLLAESHAAVHTYPEHRYLALDVFSCGSSDPQRVLELFQQELAPRRIDVLEQTRGRVDAMESNRHADGRH